MTHQTASHAAEHTTTASTTRILQRACACGNSAAHISGECEECQRAQAFGLQAKLVVSAANDPFEHDADRAAAEVLNQPTPAPGHVSSATAPRVSRRPTRGATLAGPATTSVTATLRTPGEPLTPSTRAFFEPRFGHDFSRVRIHRDAPAAASARAVAAHAYTVGHHVVFARGRYAPQIASGRALLAHELAHVVQQRAVVQRSAVSPEPETRSSQPDNEEDDALRLAAPPVAGSSTEQDAGGVGVLQRQPDGTFLDDVPGGGWPEKDEAAAIRAEVAVERACVAATPADPAECDPAAALTWADFTGRAPRGNRFGASTHSSLRERSINTALLRCMPSSASAAGAPSRGLQAVFNPGRSGVKPQFANPANPATNGCQRHVARCERFFDRHTRAGRVGITYGLSSAASRRCPAGAAAHGDQATSRAACATVVASDCADRAAAESARLLRHEQGHFDLTCAMARKANAMLTTTPDFGALLRAARTTLSRQQRLYDRQTNHGCNASDQASWEAEILAGLPAVTITVRRGRGRRGRRRRGRGRGRRR